MSEPEMLNTLKVMTGENNNEVLSVYLLIAKDKVLNCLYPYRSDEDGEKDVPERYQSVQIEIAVYLLNKRGAEGETVHTENGISRTYGSSDVPPAILRKITPFTGAIK